MSNDATLQNTDLSFLTMATYGVDSIDTENEIKLNECIKSRNSQCILTKGHGMSETCGCASNATNDYNIPASVGVPMPLTTYVIVAPETEELLRFEDDLQY